MALYFIGLGLHNENDISLKGLEAIKRCDFVYFEGYTGRLECELSKLEELYGKKVVLATRDIVEQSEEIIEKAKKSDVAFLVVGDVFTATTHLDLFMRAKKKGVKCFVIHNASIFSAVSITGLQLYKFGKTTSIPFPEKGFEPESFYDVLSFNKRNGLHTLFLLDLRPDEQRFMRIGEAINILLKIEKKKKKNVFTEKTLCIGVADIGAEKPKVVVGTSSELKDLNLGKKPQSLIVPSGLHFLENEMLDVWKKQSSSRR